MYMVNKVMLTKLQMTKEPPVLSLQNLNWHTVTRLSYLLYDVPCSWHNIKLLVIMVPNKRELIFFYFTMKTCFLYSLEVPQHGTCNNYPQHTFSWISGPFFIVTQLRLGVFS